MTDKTLIKLNEALVEKDGVYENPVEFRKFDPLCSYLNIAVPKLLNSGCDLTLFSIELETQLDTPELRLEFGASIHNSLRVCKFDQLRNNAYCLDLSQDFGGSAHHLSELFSHVDSVKLDVQRALYSKKRFPDTSNVAHIAADIKGVNLPLLA